MAGPQYVTRTIGGTDYLEAQYTTRWQTGERHHICPICHWEYPESKMVRVQGQWFCVPLKDFEEALDRERRKKAP